MVGIERLLRLLFARRKLHATSRKRLCVAGSVKAAATAALSLAMTGLGVPLGAHIPCQNGKCRPGVPASSTVGTSGAGKKRCLAMTAKTLNLPAR
jgi:hypothetical protein